MVGSTFEDLWLSSQPDVPAPGKWTKLGSILSFLLLGHNCCNCLGQTYKASIAAIQLHQKKYDSKRVQDGDDDLDPALTSDIYWSAVNGKRAKNGLMLTGKSLLQFHVLVLAIMQEVTHFLTYWHLKGGHHQNRQSMKAPPLLNIANPKYSPYLLVLQYLVSLLTDFGRVRLVCIGFSNVQDWEEQRKEEVRTFRRIVMYVSGWVYRRHLKFAEQPPVSTCVTCLYFLVA